MGQDLKSMIEEINDASSSLNRNNKPDDPVRQDHRYANVGADIFLSFRKWSESSTAILLNFNRLIKALQHCSKKSLLHKRLARDMV